MCPTVPVFKQVLKLEVESDQNVNDPDVKAAILQEVSDTQKFIFILELINIHKKRRLIMLFRDSNESVILLFYW